MGRLGAHVTVAGGLENGPRNGVNLGCESIQIFSKNQRQWSAKPITGEQAAAYRDAYGSSGLEGHVVHGSYLINLAQPDPAKWRQARDAFVDELRRCEQLGIAGLVFHPGAHMGEGEEKGLARIAQALGEALDATQGSPVDLLFEVMAGQGSVVGYRLEHLRDVAKALGGAKRFGACFDTCHLHAADYDLTTREGYDDLFAQAKRLVGLDRVRAFHLNDSRTPRGSRVDRHEAIGQGSLGLEPFWRLVNDDRFASVPMILETPPGDDFGYARDLLVLKGLRGRAAVPKGAAATALLKDAAAGAKRLVKELERRGEATGEPARGAKPMAPPARRRDPKARA